MAGMMEKTWQARGHNGMQLPSHFFTFNKIFLLDVQYFRTVERRIFGFGWPLGNIASSLPPS